MKIRGPYVTMVAGLATAAVLGLLSSNAAGDAQQAAAQNAAQDTAAQNAGKNPGAAATTPPADAGSPAAETPDAAKPAVRKAVYAGSVDGGEASLAVSIKNGKAIAYICDGNRLEAWLSGTVQGNQVTLKGEGNATLNAEIQNGGNRLVGTVAAKKRSFDFTIRSARKPSGLYQAAANVRGARIVGSWIVLADGTQVGVVSQDGEPGPAPEFDVNSGAVTVDGNGLTALPVGPDGGGE